VPSSLGCSGGGRRPERLRKSGGRNLRVNPVRTFRRCSELASPGS
jgi:hypothetical protein